jgi:hypothetical protein
VLECHRCHARDLVQQRAFNQWHTTSDVLAQ